MSNLIISNIVIKWNSIDLTEKFNFKDFTTPENINTQYGYTGLDNGKFRTHKVHATAGLLTLPFDYQVAIEDGAVNEFNQYYSSEVEGALTITMRDTGEILYNYPRAKINQKIEVNGVSNNNDDGSTTVGNLIFSVVGS